MASGALLAELEQLINDPNLEPREVEAVLSFGVGSAELRGRRLTAKTEADDVLLVLDWADDGLRLTAGPATTDELLEQLVGAVRLLREPGEDIVWRMPMFSALPVTGYWRFENEWQILPVPPEAPRPPFAIGDHPFLLELRGRSIGGHAFVDAIRFHRRHWEIRLVLDVLLTTLRPEPGFGGGHVWVLNFPRPDGDIGEPMVSQFRQVGYALPPPEDQPKPSEFSPVDDLQPVAEVGAVEYYARLGIMIGNSFDVPDLLEPALRIVDALEPEPRERFLRAAFWFNRSLPARSISASLAYVSLINSVEAIANDPQSPPIGPSERFGRFLETYVGELPERAKLYNVRSSLVHGDHLLRADMPGHAFGGLNPDDSEEDDRFRLAANVVRVSLIRWLFAVGGDRETR